MKNKNNIRLLWLLCPTLSIMAGTASAQQQQWNPGFSIGTASGQYDFSAAQAPGELSVLLAAAIPNTTGVSYQWYSSPYPTTDFTPIPGATGTTYTVSSPLTATMYYKLMAAASGIGTDSSNTIQINLVSANWEDINYLRVHDVLTTGITTWQQVDQLPIGQKLQTTTYLDGLGRTLEHVSRGTATPPSGSSTWGDMVSFAEYDSLGRQPLHYLPYTTDTLAGKYKPTPLSQQPEYYGSVYNETSAFTNTTFDNSPLNRVVNVKEPGASWAAAAGDGASYDMNTAADSVQEFGVDYIQGDAPVHLGAYAPNTLYKLTTTDENGKAVVTYTDMSGRLILKKIQVSGTPSTGHAGWICVYNVYDDFGLLRYRIQPDGVNYLEANGWSFAGTAGAQILAEQCFQYNYDDKGRVIWKKAPGQQPQQMIYDIRDRLVFSQDGNQAALATPQWTATLYDDLDRPVITTLYNTTETPAQLQTDVNNSVSVSSVTVNNPGGAITNLVVDNRNTAITTYQARNSITFVADAGGSFSTQPGDSFVAEINPNAVDSTTTTTVAVFNNPISQANLNDTSVTTILKYQYYDNYAFTNAKPFSTNFDNTNAYSAGGNVMPIAVSERTLGFPTGSMVRVLGTHTFLNNTDYYDEKGRLIQTQEDNILQGQDISTYQYHFDGRLLSMDRKHSTAHTGYSNFDVLTKYDYDLIGRVDSIQKEIGGATWKTLAAYAYDDMGRLKTKILDPDYPPPSGSPAGGGLESQSYSYNIHNQITGINKDYALKTPGVYSQWNHYFGEYLGYDNKDHVFNAAQLDGQVTGQMWNTQGDAVQRRYDYTYDDADRLNNAMFEQRDQPDSLWGSNVMNFSVTGSGGGPISYDLNGNLLSLQRMGVIPGNTAPQIIDNLTYTYGTNSNKLLDVQDAATTPDNGMSGDFKDGTNNPSTSPDYAYDGNGNLVADQNKGMGTPSSPGITYNYLDKPSNIIINPPANDTSVKGGTIRLIYDADGDLLQRSFTLSGSDTTITTSYADNFVYQDTTPSTDQGQPSLAYVNFEEGRIRVIQPISESNGYDGLVISGNMALPGGMSGVWDYFVRDYQENVRSIVTEEIHEGTNECTMEMSRKPEEDPVFQGSDDELDNTRVPITVIPGQTTGGGWHSNTSGYVCQLANLSGEQMTGPNVLLKVMAGDTINAAVQYYYPSPVTNTTGSTGLVQDVLASLMNALTSGTAAPAIVHGNEPGIQTELGNSVPFASLAEPDVNNASGTNPKAYLTVMFFDEQFNYVGAGSEEVRVSQSGDGAAPLVLADIKAPKNGYAYIYISNESPQTVYFDNLQVALNRGHLIEDDGYYPYGLQVAGISDEKLGDPHEGMLINNYLYNDKELFEQGGLDWYNYGFRNYDPQIARFTQLDPLTDEFATLTPYQYASDEPIGNVDIDGLEGGSVLNAAGSGTKDFTYFYNAASDATRLWSPIVHAASPASTSFKFLQGLGNAERFASLALHAVQVTGTLINGPTTTKEAGDAAGYRLPTVTVTGKRNINWDLRPSNPLLNFLKSYESDVGNFYGGIHHMYNDATHNATVGYGHLIHKGIINGSEQEIFRRGLTENQAMDLFKRDVMNRSVFYVKKYVEIRLTQYQFDALTSFQFNITPRTFLNSSVLKFVNKQKFGQVRNALLKFDKGTINGIKVTLPGLKLRRTAEADIFDFGIYNSSH